jgi:hypothetical protein
MRRPRIAPHFRTAIRTGSASAAVFPVSRGRHALESPVVPGWIDLVKYIPEGVTTNPR